MRGAHVCVYVCLIKNLYNRCSTISLTYIVFYYFHLALFSQSPTRRVHSWRLIYFFLPHLLILLSPPPLLLILLVLPVRPVSFTCDSICCLLSNIPVPYQLFSLRCNLLWFGVGIMFVGLDRWRRWTEAPYNPMLRGKMGDKIEEFSNHHSLPNFFIINALRSWGVLSLSRSSEFLKKFCCSSVYVWSSLIDFFFHTSLYSAASHVVLCGLFLL